MPCHLPYLIGLAYPLHSRLECLCSYKLSSSTGSSGGGFGVDGGSALCRAGSAAGIGSRWPYRWHIAMVTSLLHSYRLITTIFSCLRYYNLDLNMLPLYSYDLAVVGHQADY